MIDGGTCLGEVIKLLRSVFPPGKFVLGLTIFSGLALFLPELILSRIGINELVQNYRPFIGGVFLLLLTLWSVFIIGKIYQWVKFQIKGFIWSWKQEYALRHLDVETLIILLHLIRAKGRKMYLDPLSEITCYLAYYGFIVQLQHHTTISYDGSLGQMAYAPSIWLLKKYKSGELNDILNL